MASTGSGSVGAAAQKQVPKGLWALLILLKGGVDTRIPATSSVPVDGQSIAQPALSSELAGDIALFQNVMDLETQLKAARAKKSAGMGAMRKRYKDVKTALIVFFGKDNPILASFGITPPKARRKLTSAEELVKSGRSETTRVRRHTMGSQEKQAIQGERNVTVTVGPGGQKTVTPVPAANGGTSQQNG